MIWLSLLLAALAVGLFIFRGILDPRIRATLTLLVAVVAVASLLAAAISFVAMVPAGHVGIAVVFGKVQDRQLNEGLNFVNPFAHVVSMTVRTETYTMSSVRDEGAVKGDDSNYGVIR